ncbi:nucleotidyltransferase domain-containing protein [Clostridium sardiniense]|uniref:nucleotidyltransferase domain-containing protein n=1 Tax=Clostridium sardiniense TaxID=29369 RepID=UPI00195DC76B|nr:nucleotidyltransferase domain-containing protein [Clostridium sardiniense]MBM7836342.1 putative nucleotidyltransferase [Clostridium sardiniense]
MKNIINKINTKEYNFLSENEHLGDNIILLTLGGSHAYGTNVEGSDLDIRGIAVERPKEIIGLSSFEQFENRETDTVIYGLRKVISLMQNCNPNVIEMLGTKDNQLIICNKYGNLIRDNLDLFLSKKAIHSFGGYATAQLRRLQNALARDSYPQEEKEKHILDSIKNQLNSIEDRYKNLENGNLKLFLDKSDKEDMDQEIFMSINISDYPLRDFKNIYSEMNNIVKDYGKLNHRNSKKDELHLNKHAMHLIRLLIMGKEILEGKGVNTYRGKEKDMLLDIRSGKYTYNEIFEMVDKYDSEFKYAAENTNLPEKPNYKKIEELVMQINKEVILNAD